MEQILQKTLRDNEKVLWFGRPTKTKLLRSPDRVSQYVAWIITAVMTLFSFGVFLPFAIADNKSIGIILIGLVPMIGIPLAVAVRDICSAVPGRLRWPDCYCGPAHTNGLFRFTRLRPWAKSPV